MPVTRGSRAALAAVAAMLAVACGTPGPPPAARPVAVPLTAVPLPDGAEPEVLAVSGDALLVGVRRGGTPAVLRRAADGAVTAVPTRASTGYGRTASWYALTADGTRILGVGGDRGGAHGNVRWSVWTGTPAGVDEHAQAFSTFGGWGAGDLVGAAFAPAGPVLVGSWQSDGAGLDVAVWSPSGDTWDRQGSTGTALASTRATQGFATSATSSADGVLVTGWQVGGPGHPGQAPVVWSSGGPGPGGWVRTALPDAGSAGTADAATCAAATCAVAGRVDGALALWRWTDRAWSRVPDLPVVAVGEADRVPAPLLVDGRLLQVVVDGGTLAVVDVDGARVTRHPATGPTGPVEAATVVGRTVFVLAGDPVGLWTAAAPGP